MRRGRKNSKALKAFTSDAIRSHTPSPKKVCHPTFPPYPAEANAKGAKNGARRRLAIHSYVINLNYRDPTQKSRLQEEITMRQIFRGDGTTPNYLHVRYSGRVRNGVMDGTGTAECEHNSCTESLAPRQSSLFTSQCTCAMKIEIRIHRVAVRAVECGSIYSGEWKWLSLRARPNDVE